MTDERALMIAVATKALARYERQAAVLLQEARENPLDGGLVARAMKAQAYAEGYEQAVSDLGGL